MLSDLINTYGERLIIAVVGVGLAFVALIAVLWLVRRRGGPAPFLKGGRNRQPRLQVLDATAVDARRRLVLVRRDNVEHLIMIGGPTDIVVESGIGAIPFVTDITERDQALLDDIKPAPAINRDTPVVPAPSAQKEIAARKEPEAPLATVKPDVVLAQEPVLERPTLEPAAPRPVNEPTKASNPLMTSAMRQRATVSTAPTNSESAAQPPAPARVEAAAAPVAAATPSIDPAVPAAATTIASGGFARAVTTQQEEPTFASAKLEPVTSHSVDDIFAAARERVLPDLAANDKTQPATPAFDDRFSAELRDDFESFLNAEIEKNAPQASPEPIKAPDLSRVNQPAPITGANVDRDAQKEMARIFGEMAVKRD
jgi:hypothetical protein